MTTTINAHSSIGELVADQPARAAVFERVKLDYCCNGAQTLDAACRARGLETDAVLAALAAADLDAPTEEAETVDWRQASIRELCTHIVAVHHDGLRESFPRIEGLLATVVRVHGGEHPELRQLQEAFDGIRRDLAPHLDSEERELFPACQALEDRGQPVDEASLAEHEREHHGVGEALAALRVIGGDYDAQSALCNTHRALLDALARFERDLHQHIHEENNILIARVRTLGGQPDPSLPRCCQAWIAEQARGWSKRPA